jgi:Carboxypeptidase regulatory-like domain
MRSLYSHAVSLVFTAFFTLIVSSSLSGQATSPQLHKVRGIVKDPSGAVMPAVDVAMIQGTTVKATKTDDAGLFSFDLPTGQYQIGVKAPDFETHTGEVRVVPNMGALTIELSLAGIKTAIEVVGNNNQIVVDASQSLDATNLTAEQIAALPDDEEDLLAYLQSLAGGEGNAQLIIDGFEGGCLGATRLLKSSSSRIRSMPQEPAHESPSLPGSRDRGGHGPVTRALPTATLP